jgi:hypothetical protein
VSIGVCSILGFTFYKGVKWFCFTYKKLKQLNSVINNIENTTNMDNSCEIITNDDNLMLKYKYFGQSYHISVPYKRKHISNMISFRATLVYENNEQKDITQQPGIPYNLSAKQLGGKFVIITNDETGCSHTYQLNDIPMYAKELFE